MAEYIETSLSGRLHGVTYEDGKVIAVHIMDTDDVVKVFEPVRHGQWEWCKDYYGDSILVCSECGRVCHEEDALYCYCGAKMDGKSNVPRTEGE